MTLISVLVVAALLCAIGSLAGKVPIVAPVLLITIILALEQWPLR